MTFTRRPETHDKATGSFAHIALIRVRHDRGVEERRRFDRVLGRQVGADQLPPVDLDRSLAAIGTSTENAIRSGVGLGATGAVRELISAMRKELNSDAQLFFTGGDAEHFADLIDGGAQLVPHLVALGIARVVQRMASR